MHQLAQITNPAITGIIGQDPDSGAATTQLFLSNFVSLGLGIAGIATFFMLLFGGFEYITAGGDKEATQKAAKTITSALIGLAIVLSIFAIIYVVEILFGISIAKFTIPTIN